MHEWQARKKAFLEWTTVVEGEEEETDIDAHANTVKATAVNADKKNRKEIKSPILGHKNSI